MTTGRLSAEDWIKAGFKTLSLKGAFALKAEALARDLGATKGSFYWHFKDVPDFHRQMISVWEREGTARIIGNVQKTRRPAREALRFLYAIIGAANEKNEYGGVLVEPAIREWARANAFVAKHLKSVDDRRIAFVASLFRDSGFDDAIAVRNARLLYAALIGFQAQATTRKINLALELTTLLDLLLAAR